MTTQLQLIHIIIIIIIITYNILCVGLRSGAVMKAPLSKAWRHIIDHAGNTIHCTEHTQLTVQITVFFYFKQIGSLSGAERRFICSIPIWFKKWRSPRPHEPREL